MNKIVTYNMQCISEFKSVWNSLQVDNLGSAFFTAPGFSGNISHLPDYHF